MNVEIERKFLVKSEAWRGLAEGVRFRQGYLQTHPCTVRVRTEGERGVLTIKGQTRGFSREEFEYEIPRGGRRQDARHAGVAIPHRQDPL